MQGCSGPDSRSSHRRRVLTSHSVRRVSHRELGVSMSTYTCAAAATPAPAAGHCPRHTKKAQSTAPDTTGHTALPGHQSRPDTDMPTLTPLAPGGGGGGTSTDSHLLLERDRLTRG